MKRIKVIGIHKRTGTLERLWYDADAVGGYDLAAQKARNLHEAGFVVVVIDPYEDVRGPVNQADNEYASEIESPVKYPYKVHSINTVNQQRQGSHIGFVETLGKAIDRATSCVESWNAKHKGVVIYKAIKLVRRHDSPIEITDL